MGTKGAGGNQEGAVEWRKWCDNGKTEGDNGKKWGDREISGLTTVWAAITHATPLLELLAPYTVFYPHFKFFFQIFSVIFKLHLALYSHLRTVVLMNKYFLLITALNSKCSFSVNNLVDTKCPAATKQSCCRYMVIRN